MFDVAYFFRIDPAAVLALPWQTFEMYLLQMIRISEQIEKVTNGR